MQVHNICMVAPSLALYLAMTPEQVAMFAPNIRLLFHIPSALVALFTLGNLVQIPRLFQAFRWDNFKAVGASLENKGEWLY
jgi:hypothetical protein